MKEFKYTINGNKYEVTIGNIEGRNVELTVNGEPYTVQMEPNEVKKERVKVSAPKPAILFGGKLVAFLLTPTGLIELVEE